MIGIKSAFPKKIRNSLLISNSAETLWLPRIFRHRTISINMRLYTVNGSGFTCMQKILVQTCM